MVGTKSFKSLNKHSEVLFTLHYIVIQFDYKIARHASGRQYSIYKADSW